TSRGSFLRPDRSPDLRDVLRTVLRSGYPAAGISRAIVARISVRDDGSRHGRPFGQVRFQAWPDRSKNHREMRWHIVVVTDSFNRQPYQAPMTVVLVAQKARICGFLHQQQGFLDLRVPDG